jgi:hypothetical protein
VVNEDSANPRSPAFALPNPEPRPISEWSTLSFLDSLAADGGTLTLWGLRISRCMLNEHPLHLNDLVTLWRRWQAASTAPDAIARLDVPSPPPRSAHFNALVALGQAALAAAPQRMARLPAYSLLLRSVVYSFDFQARVFALFHRVTDDPQVRGIMPGPSAVLHARSYAIGGFPVTYFGSQFPDQFLQSFSQMRRCGRLRPGDQTLLTALRHCVEQGMAPCIEMEADAALIAAVSRDGQEMILYDPISGISEVCSRSDFDHLIEHIQVLVLLEGDLSSFDRI